MSRIARALAETVFDVRFSRGAVPDAFPGYERNPEALATDLRFKRWARLAAWLGADLSLLAALCGTDKFGIHDYTPVYEVFMRPVRRRPVCLLELGVGGYAGPMGGESLLMWAAYFRKGRIFGIDIADKTPLSAGRIRVFQCSQTDRERLTKLCAEIGPFDFIIDDGSHISADQIESFEILWPFLKSGGSYVVEDVQTSYWPAYGGGLPPSPAYERSCLSYFKRLVDSVNSESGAPGMSIAGRSIGHIGFHHDMIVIGKAQAALTPLQYRYSR
jgi:hypothetical protein